MRYIVTFCKPWSLSLFRAASLHKPKYQHVIPETGTNLGSHPDRYGCKTYLKLTVHWLGNSKVWMACYRGSENSFHSGKTGTEQWMGKAKCRDGDNGLGRSFSSSKVRRWIQEILQNDGSGFVPCSCPHSREQKVTGPARGKNKNAPVPTTLHTLLSEECTPRPAPASTFLLFDWTSLLLSL